MAFKLVFAIFALIAFQGVFGNVESESMVEEYSVVEDVAAALEKLKNVVDETVTGAIKQLNEILNDILEFAKGIVVSGTDKVGDKVKEIINKINDLVGNAESSGVDVTDCVFNKNEEIASIGEGLVQSMVDCVEKIIVNAKDIIVRAIDDVNSVLGIVIMFEKDVKECGSGITAVPCLGKVLAEITAQTVKIPISVAKNIAKVVIFAATVKTDLAACESQAVSSATGQLAVAFNNIAKCIQDKIQKNDESMKLPKF